MKLRTLVLVLLAVALLAVAGYAIGGHDLLRDIGTKIHGPR